MATQSFSPFNVVAWHGNYVGGGRGAGAGDGGKARAAGLGLDWCRGHHVRAHACAHSIRGLVPHK